MFTSRNVFQFQSSYIVDCFHEQRAHPNRSIEQFHLFLNMIGIICFLFFLSAGYSIMANKFHIQSVMVENFSLSDYSVAVTAVAPPTLRCDSFVLLFILISSVR